MTKRIPGLDTPCQEQSLEPLNIPFALFSRYLLHSSTLGRNFEHLTLSHNHLGYRPAITMLILGLDSPHQRQSLQSLNVPFAPFSKPFPYTSTLGGNFDCLTIAPDYLGYRHAIIKQLPGLDSPHRERLSESLKIPFGPFSRAFFSTFTLGRNFELLTNLYDILGYRQAIARWRAQLDSPHWGLSGELLKVSFELLLSSLPVMVARYTCRLIYK